MPKLITLQYIKGNVPQESGFQLCSAVLICYTCYALHNSIHAIFGLLKSDVSVEKLRIYQFAANTARRIPFAGLYSVTGESLRTNEGGKETLCHGVVYINV